MPRDKLLEKMQANPRIDMDFQSADPKVEVAMSRYGTIQGLS